MSSFRWVEWKQPILTSNTGYGILSVSSVNSSLTTAWKALDGRKEGNDTSWESFKDVYPASWLWKLPVTLKITKMVLYNKYSSRDSVTKNVSVYSDEKCTTLIGRGTFECMPFAMVELSFDEAVVTDTICIVCDDSYLIENTYVGLGEVEITAEQGIQQYTVVYEDWDGSILKHETVDAGERVTAPPNPTRKGYVFERWNASTERVVADIIVTAVYTKLPSSDSFLLTTLTDILTGLKIEVETGVFNTTAPERYAVLVPMSDDYEIYADNLPRAEVQSVRISIFDKGNYLKTKNNISRVLLDSDITITDKRYIGYETETGYHHYAIDVAKNFELEE